MTGETIALIIKTAETVLLAAISGFVAIQGAKMSRTMDKVHKLTNSAHTAGLRAVERSSRRLAKETKLPSDILDHVKAVTDLKDAEDATKADPKL